MKPLCIDLFAGLGGWAEGFLAEGYDVIGFDIERHDYGTGGYPGQLVIQDVLTLHGSSFRDATIIVGSSPCQRYSYMAMPWTRAKQMAHEYQTGIRDVEELNELFDAQFRIQREACEATGRHIPLIVENVRGAIPWVGQSRWHYGSFHLWGDVPALMPIAAQLKLKGGDRNKNRAEGHAWSSSFADTLAAEGFKTGGMNWSDETKRGQDFTRIAGLQNGVKLLGNNSPRRWEDREVQRLADAGKNAEGTQWRANGCNEENRMVPSRQISKAWRDKHYDETDKMQLGTKHGAIASAIPHGRESGGGIKQAGISGTRNNGKGDKWFQDGAARHGSKSNSRKAASAQIARIPLPLAKWIAKCFKPEVLDGN